MGMIKRFLLGRGLNKAQELAAKWIRHGIGWIGAAELTRDHIQNPEQLVSLEGGALVLVSIAWSMARTFFEKKLSDQ